VLTWDSVQKTSLLREKSYRDRHNAFCPFFPGAFYQGQELRVGSFPKIDI